MDLTGGFEISIGNTENLAEAVFMEKIERKN